MLSGSLALEGASTTSRSTRTFTETTTRSTTRTSARTSARGSARTTLSAPLGFTLPDTLLPNSASINSRTVRTFRSAPISQSTRVRCGKTPPLRPTYVPPPPNGPRSSGSIVSPSSRPIVSQPPRPIGSRPPRPIGSGFPRPIGSVSTDGEDTYNWLPIPPWVDGGEYYEDYSSDGDDQNCYYYHWQPVNETNDWDWV
jgi:hypothetical protein